MIRIVLDTNILVSALLRAGSLPGAILDLALNGAVELCVSEAILAEYREVLVRPRLRIDPASAFEAIRRIQEGALLVRPVDPVSVCADPDDNLFLECAKGTIS